MLSEHSPVFLTPEDRAALRRRKAKPIAAEDADALVRRFLAERQAQQCPIAYAAPVTGAQLGVGAAA